MYIMKNIFAGLMAIITLVLNFFGISSEKPVEKVENFRVTTYIRGDAAQNPDSIHAEDFDIVTDVIVFECATFDNKGNVNVETEKLEKVLNNLRNAIGDRDIHITLNLLGPRGYTDSTDWHEQMEVQSDEHNKAFRSGVLEENIVEVLDKYDFDGVHFDYEYPLSDKAWYYYNRFLYKLDKELGDYTLGVAASCWNLNFTAAAIDAVDTFEIMTYDYVDAQGKHATYEDTIAQMGAIKEQELPLEKVNLGLPFYSRPTDLSAYWYDYSSCYSKIDENGWYHCPNTGKDFWFNTPDVIEAKTEYAINNGYGGVMIWHYHCDLPSSHEGSLLRAIDTAISNNY